MQVQELQTELERLRPLERYRVIVDPEAEVQRLRAEAAHFEGFVLSLKNMVDGYGDEYLLPADDLVEQLAAEMEHDDAGQRLKAARQDSRTLIKFGRAAECNYSEKKRAETAKVFVLDAFNGKVDSIIAQAKSDNYGKLKQQLEDAYFVVNEHGTAFRNARITEEYRNARLSELEWTVVVQEMKRRDREEQKRIREEMREEARVQKEIEKALKQSEKEEKAIEAALAKARVDFEAATQEKKASFEAKLRELEAKVREAEERHQRAISMAQQTKRGHVYVISNVGSFGEHVYKVGMPRRLEPHERVKELGDASVPFEFDVHAMLFSEDAPALEKKLHEVLGEKRVNLVNMRKEFFTVSLGEIREQVEAKGISAHWTMKAKAEEYYESRNLRRRRTATILHEDVEAVAE